MGRFAQAFGPDHPEATYIAHAFPERTFALRGRVVWAKKVPAQLAHVIECGMGIRYVQPSAEFRDYFERWLA